MARVREPLHGSERFVGGVGWRQNEQTYDGFRATYKGVPGLVLDYAYVDNVNRVFGPDDGRVQPGDLKGDNHFIRVDWTVADKHVFTPFAYLLDGDRNIVMRAQIATQGPDPQLNEESLADVQVGTPTLIAPGRTNLVGGVVGLRGYAGIYLFVARPVDPDDFRGVYRLSLPG